LELDVVFITEDGLTDTEDGLTDTEDGLTDTEDGLTDMEDGLTEFVESFEGLKLRLCFRTDTFCLLQRRVVGFKTHPASHFPSTFLHGIFTIHIKIN